MEQSVNQVLSGTAAVPAQATAALLAALKNQQLDVLGLVSFTSKPCEVV
jgi:hypothetical protein